MATIIFSPLWKCQLGDKQSRYLNCHCVLIRFCQRWFQLSPCAALLISSLVRHLSSSLSECHRYLMLPDFISKYCRYLFSFTWDLKAKIPKEVAVGAEHWHITSLLISSWCTIGWPLFFYLGLGMIVFPILRLTEKNHGSFDYALLPSPPAGKNPLVARPLELPSDKYQDAKVNQTYYRFIN